MTVLVSAETVLLVLLVVLVAGLLRSHAEILRRLGPGDDLVTPGDDLATPPSSPPRSADAPAPSLAGVTPDGDAVGLSFDGPTGAPTLLAFLTSGCSTCAGFWETLGERRLPASVQTVIVAHGSERERPAKLRQLAPGGLPVVMSSQAWQDYRVPGAPYFVLVNRTIRGEGVATNWPAVASLVSDAIEDELEAAGGNDGAGRAGRIDETLAAAGINPDDPSLYPAGRSSDPSNLYPAGRSSSR
jgi:hypothetical protein